MKDQKIYIFCDGGSRGNPGPAGIGFIIKDNKGKTEKIFCGKKYLHYIYLLFGKTNCGKASRQILKQ